MSERLNGVRCPGCGELVDEQAIACPNCGEQIDVEVPGDMTHTRHPPLDLPMPDPSVLSSERPPER
ncbi:MAG: zinc ribbon domain-containing protein [Planctomycetaceae bacterium]